MIQHSLSSGRVRLAALCCALTIAILAWTTSEALRPPRHRPIAILASPVVPSPIDQTDAPPAELIENAIDHDPFSTPQQRSASPPVSSSPTAAPSISTPEVLRLVGTVVDSSGGSFVLCQLGTAPARVLRIGQELGPYELHSISQGAAIFLTADGQRLELRVPKTGS